ncbi:MAG: hypothetical protein R2767_09020 [Chitinophagales bacterium]|nr:hypothetical protein [Chitinophagales bacterium]HPE98865.1 hypothetical protein [Chitinophagales bacterium]HRX24935.1 hypothetical protein [Chitinophagales bacterium]
MRWHALFVLFMLVCVDSESHAQLDTVMVYNVHCSYSDTTGDTVNFYNWGGSWTSFFPTEECVEPKEKYGRNRDTVMTYVQADKPFWFMLYDTKDHLLYEGLHYRNCTVGPFIVYHPNGKVRMRGQYSGAKWKDDHFKVTDCEGKPTGKWISYNLIGNIVETRDYGK